MAEGSKMLGGIAGMASVEIVPPGGITRGACRIPVFFCIALALGTVALARPQWGQIEEPVFEQSREILIAVDLSRSMLAGDVTPSRIERAHLLVESLLSELEGERAGLIVFAGTSFLQVPLSSDYEIFREFLPTLKPGYLPKDGTNYASLLETALESFGNTGADRFLVVLSDGEADPSNPWRPLAEECKQRGIRAITLGVGTSTGAMIPDGAGGSLLKDDRGAVILSRLEPATLQELAATTNGIYADASQWIDMAALIRETVARGNTGEFGKAPKARLTERFQWALAPAVLLFLASLWREFPSRPSSRRLPLRQVRTTAIATLCIIASLCATQAANVQPGTQPSLESEDPATTLANLVGCLSALDTLNTADTRAFAKATLAYGEPLHAAGKTIPPGVVDDALEAVARGKKSDPNGTDWSALRQRLEALKTPLQPQQQQQQQQNENSQPDSQKQQQQGNRNGQGGSGKTKENQEPQKQGNEQNGQNAQQPATNQDQPNQQEQRQPSRDNTHASEKQESGKQDKAGDKREEKAPQPRPGERAFDSMRDNEKKEQQKNQAGQKVGSEASPKGKPMQRVGGASTAGTPLNITKDMDAKLLGSLQDLERVRKVDIPGVLFQRMQQADPANSQQAQGGQRW